MKYEKHLKVTRDGKEEMYTYYAVKTFSEEFECDMYNVGIETKCEKKEIDNFSPDKKEAVRLCDYLYKENVSPENLFLIAEEFIVAL